MFIKAVKTWVANYWLTIIYATISFVVLDQILAYRLSSLLPGSSLKELSTINADFHFGALLQNPFFLIYKLPLTALSLLHNLTIYHTRLISTALALLTVLFVYYVLRRWQGLRTAILGCLLLASSSWFLVYARMATADIVYPFLISLTLAYGTRARRTKHTGRILFLGTILSLTCIYTPGLVWLVLLAAIWQHKLLSRQIFEAPTAAVVSMAVAIGFLLPLAYAIFRQPDLVNDFLGLRSSLIHLAGNSVGNIIDGFKVLAINGQTDASLA